MCFITYSSQLYVEVQTLYKQYTLYSTYTLLHTQTKYIQVHKETLKQSLIIPDYYLNKRIKYIHMYLLPASHIRK